MGMQTMEGGCHCGAVRFRAEADPDAAMECNCSHCAIKGFVLTFTPAEKFELLSGEDKLTDYRFNKKAIAHLFCSVCGVQPFGRGETPDGGKMAAINLRCVDGLDLSALNPQPVDGRRL